ncbi:MAG: hypothetical protein LQ340_001380 [Diploschistes diacapsis]|nr:MAG: hypothetical protein LQ340_001380 [Diploschistes diacapsis]
MAALTIDSTKFADLTGKVALITGGSSGIGYAAALILAGQGAKVHILDLGPPESVPENLSSRIEYHQCDITSWPLLRDIFQRLPRLDLLFANAGVSETVNSFEDTFDEAGLLQEPSYGVLGVNLRCVLNVVKLGWSHMRKNKIAGSIVLTISATAYAPEQSLPVYSAAKLALVGLVRSLRSTITQDNITINGVAPAATITKLLPGNLAAPIMAAGLPVSSAHFVALALVWSAVGTETRKVEVYGREDDANLVKAGRWNGRVILTLGDTYTELEEPIANLRPEWFGKENLRLTRMQQAATDARSLLL